MLKKLLLATMLLGVLPGFAMAQTVDAAKVAAIGRDAAAFAALADGSAKQGNPPRMTDPAVRALLDEVFDTSALQDGPAATSDDLGPLGDWSQAAVKIDLVYLLAGTGYDSLDNLPSTRATSDQINKNTIAYAAEIGRFNDAALWIERGVLQAAADFTANADASMLKQQNIVDGLNQMRSGVARTISGDFSDMALDGLSDGWRLQRLPALLAIAPVAAEALPAELVQQLHDSANQTADQMQNPGVKQGLLAVAALLTK
jgi:hypothetical protein